MRKSGGGGDCKSFLVQSRLQKCICSWCPWCSLDWLHATEVLGAGICILNILSKVKQRARLELCDWGKPSFAVYTVTRRAGVILRAWNVVWMGHSNHYYCLVSKRKTLGYTLCFGVSWEYGWPGCGFLSVNIPGDMMKFPSPSVDLREGGGRPGLTLNPQGKEEKKSYP